MLHKIANALNWLFGAPLTIYILGISLLYTVAFRFIQVTKLFEAFKAVFAPAPGKQVQGDMTPFQAFVNTLSTGLGNGSVVGAAVAIYNGGPGAGLWVVIIGFLLMAIRFAEVYASTLYGAKAPKGATLGGPMLYLKDVAGGNTLSWLYSAACFMFSLIVGNAMQMNSMSSSIAATWGIDLYLIATLITLFIVYVVMGGAKRIIAASDLIVPIKVIVFFGSTLAIIAYHGNHLFDALALMYNSAFNPCSFISGVFGFTIMQAINAGLNLSITATESGLGTSAIFFGYTGSKDPVRSGLLGMVSTFISSIVCFLISLCIIISGVWDSGLSAAPLTIASYNTLFGVYGGYIVTFLTASFGLGVVVSFAYVSRAAWLSLSNGKHEWVFTVAYCSAAFAGSVLDAHKVFGAVGIINGVMMTLNLFGLLLLLPRLTASLQKQ